MPIVVDAEIRRMSQHEFGDLAYRVMQRVFAVHNQMGRFFDEKVYQEAIAAGLSDARTEVRIDVSFEDFCKQYFIDLLVDGGAVFELKAVERLNRRHQAQLLNYLLLVELPHGKVVNLGPELIEHEFVNTTLMRTNRIDFAVDDSDWNERATDNRKLKDLLLPILRDWGTGLEIPLYTEALTHFLGGKTLVERKVDIMLDGRRIGQQPMRLAAPDAAFLITQIPGREDLDRYLNHILRFLRHTELGRVQWINITLHQVTFRTIYRQKN
jgi:GxxExxY protein